jgi:hypothetical protein
MIDPTNPDPLHRPSVGPHAFYHVLAVSSDRPVPLFGHRHVPKFARARVAIMDNNRQVTYIDAEARWAGWPEPTALVPVPNPSRLSLPNLIRSVLRLKALAPGVTLQRYVDLKELARQRTFDFETPGQQEQIDIALKIENDNNIYFWNNRSYEQGTTHPAHTLGQGDFDVRVSVGIEGSWTVAWFRLSNRGSSWRNVSLIALAGPHGGEGSDASVTHWQRRLLWAASILGLTWAFLLLIQGGLWTAHFLPGSARLALSLALGLMALFAAYRALGR